MKSSDKNIDTGLLIQKYINLHRISKTSLGTKINRTGISVLRYTQNFSIQTSLRNSMQIDIFLNQKPSVDVFIA